MAGRAARRSDSRVDPHLTVDLFNELIFGHVQIIVHLQPEPELRRHVEVARQTQRRIRGNAPLALDDFVNPSRRHADVQGQAVLAKGHGFEKLVQEYLARVYGRY